MGNDTFELIKSGDRIIEPRLYDSFHRKIKAGDMILFINRQTNAQAVAKIVGLLRFASFKELFNSYPTERFGADEKSLLRQMQKFYSSDDELKNGVIGIKIHLLR